VKVKVVHAVCGREVLVQQILETGGHCPWDGKAFNRDYTAVLAEALGAAENAGSVLENALEKVAGTNPAITFDRESILGEIERQIARLDSRRERGGR
jgi:hypothetical protein